MEAAVASYKSGVYQDLNRMLRGSRGAIRLEASELGALDASMQALMVPWRFEDVHLYRSLHGAHAKHVSKLKVGDTFTNPGYTSTAFDPRHALEFGSTLLVMRPRPGNRFLYIDALREAYCRRPRRRQERWLFQSEVVLDKGMTLKVVKRGRGSVSDISDRRLVRLHSCSDANVTSEIEVIFVEILPKKVGA